MSSTAPAAPRDRAPPGCSPTTAPTSCGSSHRAAIRCRRSRAGRTRRSSTAASAASSSTCTIPARATGCSRSSTGPRCSSRAGAPASPTGSASATRRCTNATPPWSTCSISGFGRGFRPRSPWLRGDRAGRARRRCPTRPRTATAPSTQGSRSPSIGAASLAVLGALAALRRAREDGWGRHVETSLLDGALAYHSMLWGESDAAVARPDAPPPLQQTSTMRLVTRSFECADGEYLGLHTGAVGAFGRAMRVLGVDDRVPPSDGRHGHGRAAQPMRSARSSSSSWSTSSRPGRAPSGCSGSSTPTCARWSTSGRPRFRHARRRVTTGWSSPSTTPCSARWSRWRRAIKFTATPGEVRGPAPRIGQHTDDVLSSAAGWPPPDPPCRGAGARHPPAPCRPADRRPRRVLRGAVLLPPPGGPRRRRREDRALGGRPAARDRTTVLLRAGREARDRGQPQGSGTGPRHRGAAPARRCRPPQPPPGRGGAPRTGRRVRAIREPGDRVPARAGVGIDGPVRDAPELRPHDVRVRGRHLRGGGAVQPTPAAIGQRGSRQRVAGRDRDPPRAAPP